MGKKHFIILSPVALPVVIASAICWLLAASAHATELNIANETLSLSYDDQKARFSARHGDDAPFLVGGELEGKPVSAKTAAAKDPVFGTGKCIRVALVDGSAYSLELYPKLPFVFVRRTQANPGRETAVFASIPVARFHLNLGKPAAALRTQGTAGLTAPDKHPGSYLFLTLADPATRHSVVAGWLTHDRGSGVLFSEVQNDAVVFRARQDYGQLRVAPGKSAALETLVLGYFADGRLGEEQFADAIARHYRIHLPPQVDGYCTWYSDVHDRAGDEKSIVELARYAARELMPFGFSFVQIDDEWQDGIKTNGPARGFDRVRPDGPYPGGMKPVADQFKKLGLTAGIWFMPFARNHQDPEYAGRQDWFVKRTDGSPYETKWGGTSLDLTRPEVRAHLQQLVQTIHGWGYDYFKMDGLWTGSATEQIYVNDGYKEDHMGNYQPFHDPNVTSIEMMRSGLKLVRNAAGKDVFLSGCNLSQNMRSLSGSIGLVDSMRIGPDNLERWASWREEIAENRCGSLVTGPIRGTRLYFLNRRVWHNDPDPNYVRASMPLEQARLIASWVGLSGQFNLNSDWIPALPPERLDILKRTMPAHQAVARPVDYFDTPMPSIWLVSDHDAAPQRQVLGLFNWESTNRVISYDAAKAGLDAAQTYAAFDFWSGTPLPSFKGAFAFEVPATACRVIAIRPVSDHPQILSTSRHVTQGMMDVLEEKWVSASRTLSGKSHVVGGDPMELRITIGAADKAYRAKGIELTGADARAGAVASLAREDGLLRARIVSPASRDIRWTIQFEKAP